MTLSSQNWVIEVLVVGVSGVGSKEIRGVERDFLVLLILLPIFCVCQKS